MNWKLRAKIMKVCANMPYGPLLYGQLQNWLGRLNSNYFKQQALTLELASWLKDAGKGIAGATFLEIGTGHVPAVPIFLYLLGGAKTTTVDLHRRLNIQILQAVLNGIAKARDEITRELSQFLSYDELDARFDVLDNTKDQPLDFLAYAGVEYIAPGNAASLALPSESVDCHLSVNVLEHIPRNVISSIMKEGRRVLKKPGVSFHLVDFTDHFCRIDKTIAWYNFLRYSDAEWQHIAGNELAYTNRLRIRDMQTIFSEAGFETIREEAKIASPIPKSFPLNERFHCYTEAEVATTHLLVLLEK